MALKLARFLLFIAAGLFFSCKTPPRARPSASFARPLDERLEKIKMTDLNGKPLSLRQFAGEPLFLNFWATWCGPCISEMPSIEAAQAQFRDQVQFLAVSNESPEKIRAFLDQHKLAIPVAHLDINYIDAYIVTMPTTFLIDAAGNLKYEEEGYRDWTLYNNLEKIRAIANGK